MENVNYGYKIDVTDHVSEIFDNVKSAFLCSESGFHIPDEELISRTFCTTEINKTVKIYGECLNIEFDNGKRLYFYSSDYGEIVLRKNSEQLKPNDQTISETISEALKGLHIIGVVSSCEKVSEIFGQDNNTLEEAQEINNYLKKLPADLYLSLFHIMQQEVTGLPYAGNCCV